MSTFTIFSPSAIQQVSRPYEEPRTLFTNSSSTNWSSIFEKLWNTDRFRKFYCTEQNQYELQVLSLSATRDNISGKQTMPAVVRPKTKTHEPRVEPGELDNNVQSLKGKLCQFQTQNIQQTATSTEKIHSFQFFPGTMAEITISSEVRNSYPVVLVSNSQMNTQINPCSSQNTMTSNEKGNNIYDANGELLNHAFYIVNSVATRNIAHNTEDQIAGSSHSWQNLHQQQLLGNHLVRNEIENNIEPSHFVQPYRTKNKKWLQFCSGEPVARSTKVRQKVHSWSFTIESRTPATTIYNNKNNWLPNWNFPVAWSKICNA